MLRQLSKDEEQQVQRTKSVFSDLANDESFWSSPFSIDELDDFQVSYPGHGMPERQHEHKWYLPSYRNGHKRFVRVIVTTQNDATILVVLTNPQVPDYEIQNKTNDAIEVAQMQDESMVSALTKNFARQEDLIHGGKFERLARQSQVPFAWPYRLGQSKELAIRVGGGLMQQINIDKAMRKTEISGQSG